LKCPKCQHENPADARFCNGCGHPFELVCPECEKANPSGSRFCNACGKELDQVPEEKEAPETEGERKYVTVLFSDLSGYTAMSEKIDPEDVKEITSRIFARISDIITRYEGFVEKFVGDAVMAIFGVPKAHEDDPVRAIRAAMEIHDLIKGISPQLEDKIGQPLSMHSGINTGLVVTGEVKPDKGTHGLTGDAINKASRLEGLAKAGEILVGYEVYRQTERYFDFEELKATKVRGKAEPVSMYRVLTPKDKPFTVRRLSGLRADLIGRRVEIVQLLEAVKNLKKGKGAIISICGDAGTGKSRLVEEFKATLDLEIIQWRYGCAYPYAQNTPYFPLINLLSQAFQIEESDSPKRIREKIEYTVEYLGGKKQSVVPFVGSLFSLRFPEAEDVNPQFWKIRLHEAMKSILAALVQKGPTVICCEDLQWADPSSIELLRFVLSESRYPALFLFAHRPTFTLFGTYQLETIGYPYQEIRLRDLSPSDAQNMMESLLDTDRLPNELRRFIQEKVEGNPFYLEEVINSLIESGTLVSDNGAWRLSRSISEADISPTIHGVISGRLDRLKKETKRILQEASVIGRSFLYDILERVTELKTHLDECLRGLERLDLIRTRSLQPELEYIFKHALTQEVVYNGLLKKERQAIHERIALVMEQLFHDRLSEFYEALSYHFTRGLSAHKAVDYLVKSGGKSLRKYALEEANQYYRKAFELLSTKPNKTKKEGKQVIDLLLEWGYVHNSRGAYRELEELLKVNKELAESLDDKERLGMFYAWLGWALRSREKLKEGYNYLSKALTLGEEIESHRIIGYACAWLAWTSADLGLLDNAVEYGRRAQELSKLLPADLELPRYALGGLGVAYYFRGERKKTEGIGKLMLEYGQRVSDLRCATMGHTCTGFGQYVAGELPSAIESFKKAIQVSEDTTTTNAARLLLGMSYVAEGHFREAENTLEEVMNASEDVGIEFLGSAAQAFIGMVLIAKGNLNRGIKIVEETLQIFLNNESRYRYAVQNHVLGKIYLQIILKAGPKSLSFIARNIGFLVRSIPFADRKAEAHLEQAIEVAKEIGAKGIYGQACLDLGRLHKAKGRRKIAKSFISEAIQIFEQCEAEVYLKQAKEVLGFL